VYEGTMAGWEVLSGKGKAKHICVDSAGMLWAIGLDNGIWYREGGTWKRCPGGKKGIRIALPR
jgi:hypothetical protein